MLLSHINVSPLSLPLSLKAVKKCTWVKIKIIIINKIKRNNLVFILIVVIV